MNSRNPHLIGIRHRRWTPAEIDYLVSYYRKEPNKRIIADALHRSYLSIYVKAQKMGLSDPAYLKPKVSVFNEAELQYIRESVEFLSNRQIAEHLGRKRTTVRNQIYKMGLRRYANKRGSWNEHENGFLIQNFGHLGDVEIAKRLGRTKQSIRKRRITLNLHRTKDQVKILMEEGKKKFLKHSFRAGEPARYSNNAAKAWETRRLRQEARELMNEYHRSIAR